MRDGDAVRNRESELTVGNVGRDSNTGTFKEKSEEIDFYDFVDKNVPL